MQVHSQQAPSQRRAFVRATLSGIALSLASYGSARAQASVGKLTIGTGNLDPQFAAGYVAHKNGFFKEFGLDATLIDCQNGPRARQMLAADQISVAVSASFDALIIAAAGKETKTLFNIDTRLPYANVLVHKEDYDSGKIRKFADLAGQKVGVSGPKSAFWLMATHMVEKANIKNVEIRFIGGTPEMLAALKSRQVAASMATMTMMEQAVEQGWAVPIVSFKEERAFRDAIGLGGDVPGLSAFALSSTVAKRPAEIQAFVAGWLKGTDFLMANSAEAIVDLIHQDYLGSFERGTLVRTVATLKDKVWSRDNYLSKDAYNRILAVMGGDRLLSDAEVRKLTYETATDVSMVRKVRKI